MIETQTPCCSQEFGQQSAAGKGLGGPTLITDAHFVRDSESGTDDDEIQLWSKEDNDDRLLLAACEATEKGLDRAVAVAVPSRVW